MSIASWPITRTTGSAQPLVSEFLQAVTEVMESLWPFIEKHPRYAEQALERLVSLSGRIMFRVSWFG